MTTTVRSPVRHAPFTLPNGILPSDSFEWLQSLVNAFNGVEDGLGFRTLGFGGVQFTIGTGSPEGAVTGSPPDLYFNLAGGAGTTLYVKESGSNTSTGWVGK